MIYIPKENGNKNPKKIRLGNNEEILEPKDHLDISRIFGDKASGKLLVLSKAGVGKTSLMHYISYKWARNQLWRDEFDFVFRVRLKDLNIGWENDYKTKLENGSETDIFACFLHYSLGIGKKKIKDLNKLKYFLQSNKSKILLLIDGYDEI
jgi:GTPase SAR1 family protein